MTAPGGRACGRCGVIGSTDEMVRTKTRKGGHVWLHRECLAIWRKLKVKV